jgi:uncharacterized protein with ATP-grasp and redox domains
MPTLKPNFLGETCLECLRTQSVRLATRLIPDPEARGELLKNIDYILENVDASDRIMYLHGRVYEEIYRACKDPDPFREIKQRSTNEVLNLYPILKKRIVQTKDPLELAVRYAIAGNVIDDAPPIQMDLNDELEHALMRPLVINHLPILRQRLSQAEFVLFLGDNAGETVLDRLLIETIGLPTTYIVRGAPVINDATEEDARQARLHEVARILSSGSKHAGTILEDCATEVQELFAEAPVVVSKGQGNFESLVHQPREIFFLLKVKCDLVANHLNADIGDSILLAANVLNRSD